MYNTKSNVLFGRTLKPLGKYGGNPGFAPEILNQPVNPAPPMPFATGGLVQSVQQNIYKKKFQK